MSSDWKDATGRWRTKSLFIEYEISGYLCPFTLKDQDIEAKNKKGVYGGFRSLKKLYLKSSDPTEYQFAEHYLGGWAHWLVLRESPCIRKRLALWREELVQKLRSEAFLHIQNESIHGKDASARIAAEWIAKAAWNKQESTKGAGRPSKATIEGELKRTAQELREEREDAQRIGLLN